MNYTPEQFAALAPYEEHFRTAINAKWSRNPGRTALKTIYDNYTAATGSKDRFNPWCGNCVLNLMRKAGALWLADAEAKKAAPETPAPSDSKPVKAASKKSTTAKQAKPTTASPKKTTAKKTAGK